MLTESVNSFVCYLTDEKRLSEHTSTAYQRDLDKLVDFTSKQQCADWASLTYSQARQFPASLHSQGLSGRSIQRALSAARSFYRFLIRDKQVEQNPFIDVKAPKPGKKLPNSLTVDEIAQLLDGLPNSHLALRDRAIMEFIYSCGLRLSELRNIDMVSVAHGQDMLRVVGKGSKERDVPIGGKARSAIVEWLAVRPSIANADEPALFVSAHGSRVSKRTIQARLDYWALHTGLGRSLSPHMLRHSFASHMLESSQDLRALQELLGHANISTTQIYTHLDFQHLAKVYDLAHPRAKIK